MKRLIIIIISFLSVFFNCMEGKAQQLAVKTNALSLLTTTLNAGVEYKIASKWTTSLDVMYKPWKFLPDNKKITGLLIQPEIKYWFCQPFYHHSLGLHLHYGMYNGGLDKYRYQGDLYGAGISYGYQWVLSRNWNIGVSVGAGYAHLGYDKYYRPKCGYFIGKDSKDYIGLTQIGVNFIYIIK